MAQVAELAGVSVMTASYTYNKPGRVSTESRAKVLAAAESLGYPGPDPSARSLRRGRTGSLGVVLGESLTYAFEDPQAASFLAGVAEVCAARGLGMTILPVTGADDDGVRVREAAVDSFIVWTTTDEDPVLDAILATGRTTVVHGGPARDGAKLVTIDNRAAAAAIGGLVFAGSRQPAVLGFPLDRERIQRVERGIDPHAATYPVTRERLFGYRDAAQAAGHAWADITVAVCSTNNAVEAEALAAQLLGSAGPPDAIAAMSDEQAAGVMRAADRLGVRVPLELAVSGWDDAAVASQLGITTVAQSMRDQGKACALVAVGAGRQRTAEPWSIVARASTGG